VEVAALVRPGVAPAGLWDREPGVLIVFVPADDGRVRRDDGGEDRRELYRIVRHEVERVHSHAEEALGLEARLFEELADGGIGQRLTVEHLAVHHLPGTRAARARPTAQRQGLPTALDRAEGEHVDDADFDLHVFALRSISEWMRAESARAR